jgi:hypothetical protein
LALTGVHEIGLIVIDHRRALLAGSPDYRP